MRTVRQFRGRQRQIIRAVIKKCKELQADAAKTTHAPICNNTVLTSYVAPLEAAMIAALAATIMR